MREVCPERTNWRDGELSQRHRLWGFNCPAVDIDFLMIEYNYGKPCAIVEYKHKIASIPDTNHASYRALVALADGYNHGPLACFIAIYDPDNWKFKVIPLNDKAKKYYQNWIGVELTEQQFVSSLYLLRQVSLSKEDNLFIAELNT